MSTETAAGPVWWVAEIEFWSPEPPGVSVDCVEVVANDRWSLLDAIHRVPDGVPRPLIAALLRGSEVWDVRVGREYLVERLQLEDGCSLLGTRLGRAVPDGWDASIMWESRGWPRIRRCSWGRGGTRTEALRSAALMAWTRPNVPWWVLDSARRPAGESWRATYLLDRRRVALDIKTLESLPL